jgi:hypothetical protein
LLDTAVAGTTNVSADSNVTLTTTTGASNQARQAILLFSGARTAIRTVTAPAQSKIYTVINATTGGFAVQLVGAGPTTGVTIANGARTVVAWNGSDFVEVSSPSSIILPGGTANGVLYLNGSKVVTSGSALTFDGTTFTSTAPTTNFSGANFAMQMGTAATYGYIGNSNSQSYLQINGSSNATPNVMIFGVASSEGMRLTSTGLGIGTSSPAYKLEVNGQIGCSDNFVFTTANPAIVVNSGYLRVFTGGSERMRLDSSGNLGLGVTPSAWFANSRAIQMGSGACVGGRSNDATISEMGANQFINSSGTRTYISTAVASLYEQNSGQHRFYTAPSGTAGNAITFTQAMTLNASGNLGLGTTSPSDTSSYGRALDIQSSTGAAIYLRDSDGPTTSYGVVAYDASIDSLTLGSITASTGIIRLIAAGSERARIDSSGNLCVGVTSATTGSRLAIKGVGSTGATYNIYSTNSSSNVVFATEDGGQFYTGTLSGSPYNNTTGSAANMVVTAGGVLQRSTSSLKYKKNVQDATHGLADVLKLRAVTYEGKSESDAGKIFGGLIAEEVHEAGLTEFVQYAEDGTPDALSYGNMVSLAFKAIQEMKSIIDDQAARIAVLEAK